MAVVSYNKTTVIFGNADVDAVLARVSIKITINRPNATFGDIERRGQWEPPNKHIWNLVHGHSQSLMAVSVFVHTGDEDFLVPVLPDKEL